MFDPAILRITTKSSAAAWRRFRAAEAATGEIVAYTDSDCVADPDWLTYLVAKMEAGKVSPPAAGRISRRPRTVWCRPRSRCRRAGRPTC